MNLRDKERRISLVIPMTEPQKEIWVSCQLGDLEANLAYNESLSLEMFGPLHKRALLKALQDLVARHEALRSSFSTNGEWCYIYAEQVFLCKEIDLSSQRSEQQQLHIATFLKQEVSVPFDLLEGPLFRFTLHKLNTEQHWLTFTAHHIVCDGWSLGVLLEDLSKLYQAHVSYQFDRLQIPLKFSEYALQQHKTKNTDKYQSIQHYWVDNFRTIPPPPLLPLDFERPCIRTYTSERLDMQLDQQTLEAIKSLAKSARASLVTTLLSTFEAFLFKVTGQHDMVIGLPTAGQAATNQFFLCGHAVHLLPIRSTLDPNSSFKEYLSKRKTELLDDFDHQELSFGTLIQALHITRDPAKIPLVPIVFNIDLGMDAQVNFTDIHHRLHYNPRIAETFEVFLNMADHQGGLTLQWSYNKQLFKRSTIQQWSTQYQEVLRTFIAKPDTILGGLASGKTPQFSLEGPKQAISLSENLPLVIQKACLTFADHIAISFHGEPISYRHLEERSNQLAHRLQKHGAGSGSKVALLLPRNPEMIVALLAILKTGATYVALDPELPQDRLRFFMQDSNSTLLLSTAPLAEPFVDEMHLLTLESLQASFTEEEKHFTIPAIAAENVAYILYTSGSTGTPKGVQITHYNLLNLLFSVKSILGIQPTDRILAITTIAFDIAVNELYLPLISGSTIVLADQAVTNDQDAVLSLALAAKASIVQATPSRWQLLLAAANQDEWPFTIISTGEALPKRLAEQLCDKVKTIWNGYGPTETTVWSTLKKIDRSHPSVTIGTPLHNTKIYVLDEERQPVSRGQSGELYIAGAGVAAGYYNRPDHNQTSFLPASFDSEYPILYKTGDLVNIDENGELLYQGRADQQLKIRGYRIEPGEIEYQLSKLEDVIEAAVVLREDNPGDQRLVAYITTKTLPTSGEGLRPPKEQVAAWRITLAKQLPSYMIPNDWICLHAFPLTANQKIDKKNLPKLVKETAKHTTHNFSQADQHTTLIRSIWEEVLAIQNIQDDDDFFALGGHSLIAVQVILKIEEQTGRRLPLASLFEYPTIKQLAKLLSDQEETIVLPTLVPIKTSGNRTPIYLIHGGGLNVMVYQPLAKYISEDQPLYAFQAIGLDGQETPPDTIEEIASRYLQELLKHRPEGPYALAGYSLGGLIAYEMAKQLIALGKEIALLGILDTNAEGRDWQLNKNQRWKKKFLRQFKKAAHFGLSFLKFPTETIQYHIQLTKRTLARFQNKPIAYEDVFTYDMKIAALYDKAYHRYVIQPIDTQIQLFRVNKRIYFLDDPVYLGWKDYAQRGMVIHAIPGDHKTFLQHPHDQIFAKILEKSLQETVNT